MGDNRNTQTATYLLAKHAKSEPDEHRVKIAIIGAGNCGVAIAIAILFKRLASELVLLDVNEDLAKAEAEDIAYSAGFLGNPKVIGTKSYTKTRDAAVCVITAGTRPAPNEDQNQNLERNLGIFKVVIPNIVKHSPNTIIVVVTSPVDILSYVAMKLSGFPPNRVIGVGTFLDSCRFQYFIAKKLGVSASSVQALVIGENGCNSVPIWSAVSVAGMKLKDINKEIGTSEDPEDWSFLHKKVTCSTKDIIAKKGNCKWGIGICTSEIIDAIVRNTRTCITVSTFVKGCRHGLEKDVYMSLPCIVGRNGVQSYIRHLYSPEEQELTTKSCRAIFETQKPFIEKLE